MRSGVTRADISAAVGHKVFAYLEVTDDSDAFVNLGALAVGTATLDFFNTATLSESIDSNTLSFSAEVKNTIGLYGLSPLRTDSPVNESAVTPGTYAPRLDLHRRWRIMVAVVAPGVTPVVPTDYRELNTGYVTDLKIGADIITIEGQGMEAPILAAFVIEDRTYASDDMEDVIQLALDEQFGTGIISLSTPVSPSFLVADTIGDINLMPALSDIAALAGWSLRYRYDSADVNALTLFNPPRGNTTPDWSIADTEYERLDVELDEGPVRNFIVVKYQDATSGPQTVISPGAETGTLSCTGGVGTFSVSQAGVIADGARVVVDRTGLGDFVAYTVSAFDGTTGCTLTGAPDFTARKFYTSASITKYDLRVFVFDLSAGTQIVDATSAGNLADAVRSDREDPALVQSFMAPGLWFAQLHDLVGTGANGVIYNDDQSGGVTSYTQHFADAMLETTVNIAGSIKGRFTSWKRIGSGAGASQVLPELAYFTPQFFETNGSTYGEIIYGLGYGTRCLSALVEYGLDPTFVTVTSIPYDEGTDNPVIGGFAISGIAQRDVTFFFRATPYSGPVVAGSVTGVAGDPITVSVYVQPYMQDTTAVTFDRSSAGLIIPDISGVTTIGTTLGSIGIPTVFVNTTEASQWLALSTIPTSATEIGTEFRRRRYLVGAGSVRIHANVKAVTGTPTIGLYSATDSAYTSPVSVATLSVTGTGQLSSAWFSVPSASKIDDFLTPYVADGANTAAVDLYALQIEFLPTTVSGARVHTAAFAAAYD